MKVIKEDPRGVVAELTTKASDLAPVMPYIVSSKWGGCRGGEGGELAWHPPGLGL